VEELDIHAATLRRTGAIDWLWTDQHIPSGTDWEPELWKKFREADIIVLLVTHYFLHSKYAYDEEFLQAEERHRKREVRILPVICAECHWEDGRLDKLQVLCKEKPVRGFGDDPKAWAAPLTRVVKAIEKIALELKVKPVAQAPAGQPEIVVPKPSRIVFPAAPAVITHRIGDETEIGGLPYVWTPPGKFLMGAPKGDKEAWDDERPQHEVTITKGFWLGKTPVTQAAYQRAMGGNPSHFKGPNRPVEQVSWNGAQAYATKVGVRLPTEAEWEYAARAGTTASRYGALDEIAWYNGNSGGETHDVGGKKANAWGLHDMLGNVLEWVEDFFGEYPAEAVTDPQGPGTGTSRVLRGGSWNYNPRYARASYRFRYAPDVQNYSFGFRCRGN
jgi:hypothetical protein